MKYVIFFTAIVATAACVSFSQTSTRKQGIEGYIYFVHGNRMPSPDVKLPEPKGYSTTLYIYELTHSDKVQRSEHPAFYKKISTNLVKEIKSDKNGYFKVNLPAGKYSLFTKKDDLFYANIFDGEGNIYPVEVEKGKYTQVKINVDYDAVY